MLCQTVTLGDLSIMISPAASARIGVIEQAEVCIAYNEVFLPAVDDRLPAISEQNEGASSDNAGHELVPNQRYLCDGPIPPRRATKPTDRSIRFWSLS